MPTRDVADPDKETGPVLGDFETSAETIRALDDHQSSNHAMINHERDIDGGEKGNDSSPPRPVGFWDKSLSKTRLQVYGLWARTSCYPKLC